ADTMAADNYEVGHGAATIDRRGQRVRAITLNEAPRGIAKMHTRADEPPSSYVVNEFAARYPVDDAQDETTIGTCNRSVRRAFNRTHARNNPTEQTPNKGSFIHVYEGGCRGLQGACVLQINTNPHAIVQRRIATTLDLSTQTLSYQMNARREFQLSR